ncbi:bile acid:sodium symporter [Candidatus Uhrbacteria bacterium]|nr:bile acid:sodium symporter [Candidatus Uhrbacteria bacterium]
MSTVNINLKKFLNDNQIILVLAGLIAGALLPNVFKPISPLATPMLMAIFFTSSLRLDLSELLNYAKDIRMVVISNVIMLLFIPAAMFIPLKLFAPDWALSFLIVGAMPTGLTVALIADLFGGKASLAMLVSVTTSLLAPITVPFIFWILIGQSVPLPITKLFSSLFFTIVIPFFLALIAKRVAPTFTKTHDVAWREISLALFVLLVASAVADTVQGETIRLGWNEVGILVVMNIYMGGLAWLAYGLTGWRNAAERITLTLCMVYMNNTLALWVGGTFFKQYEVVPKLLIILAGVNALLPPIKWLARNRIAAELAKNPQRRTEGPNF